MGKYFGTDGVRGLAGQDVTSTIAYRIGRFLGQCPVGQKTRIIIARDTRHSGDMLLSALMAGITASGGEAYNLGISTTPSISYLVHRHNFDFGIMISASHNAYYDNGIKVFNRNGEKLEEDIERQIERYIDDQSDHLPQAAGKNVGTIHDAADLVQDYLDFIASKAHGDFSKLRLLIDAANGSAAVVIDQLVARLHLNVDIINNHPNGTNINDMCGSTHIGTLVKRMKTNGYDYGLAFDGDADRLLLIDHQGQTINGDAMVYLSAIDALESGRLNKPKVVLTVMSNLGIKQALNQAGIDVLEVQVGDKYVHEALKKHGLVLGGEQSGHIIFFDELNTGDGLLSMVHMLNIIAKSNARVQDLLAGLKIYPQVLKNITVANKSEVLEHEGLQALIRRVEQELGSSGRILIRPSGTEPLIRIMLEAETQATCDRYVQEVFDYIAEIFVS